MPITDADVSPHHLLAAERWIAANGMPETDSDMARMGREVTERARQAVEHMTCKTHEALGAHRESRKAGVETPAGCRAWSSCTTSTASCAAGREPHRAPGAEEESMGQQVEFADFTVAEKEAVDCIIERATSMAELHGNTLDRQSVAMDLAATHFHTPLRLAELAEADDFNLGHDVFGIQASIDRKTGRLSGHFLPRFGH